MTRGTYCLLIKLDSDREIRIGRRGSALFPAGFYCYVGSAMNSLEKRIARHLSREKRFHWHIDWLLNHSRVVNIYKLISNNRLECGFSRALEGLSEGSPMKGFGSSDCSCRSHLHYFKRNPSKKLEAVVRKWKTS